MRTRLFVRTKKGLILTPVLEEILPYVNSITESVDTIRGLTASYDGEVAGTLNIGIASNYARYRLPGVLAEYREKYPKVEIRINSHRGPTLYKELTENSISVAIIQGEYPWGEGIEEYTEMYKSIGEGADTAKQIAALKQQIELAQKKKSKLLGYNAAGQLSDRDFLSMNKACDQEISEAERQIYDLEQQQLSNAEFKKHIDTIRRVLREAKRDAAQGIINKEFVDKYIDKIFVTPEDGRLKLQIKKMLPVRTASFDRADRTAMGHVHTVAYRIEFLA